VLLRKHIIEVSYNAEGYGMQTLLIVADTGAAEDMATAEVSLDKHPCLIYYPVMPIQSPS
jgi:hypothetical protein